MAKQLKEAGCNTIYLAFDGVTPEPYINNRGKDLLPFKLDAIENCRKAGLGIVLVPTLIKGINDHQVGEIIKFAFDNNDIIYGVNFQPVSFAGRTPSDEVEEQRITIPDFVQIIEDESGVAALAKARENATINDKIIVFGSFVTVTDVLPLL